ncbi:MULTISPECIES: hypothetical protein [Pseudomonas]|uniref:Uncharacterized protein n=1 Tax=Pseudomonas asplenii TaxID=53407 RepID=A0A0M9GG79_9PSED|nr:hypothetical protein [Pseudomonas fuscovaginae]KPA90465.1 hypothetical protein PF66_02526 [Pseudomonas fuscovaginae]KPA99592.1 hypothetical protein PF70_00261 [Pseudomonas fuscovaginae]
MLLLVSGEGPSDIGRQSPGEEGFEFSPGPMCLILDLLIERLMGYSLFDYQGVQFIHKSQLVAVEPKHHGRRFSAPGKGKSKETGYYYENARRLALKAVALAQESSDVVVPVLFRDADGTQSSDRGEWSAKWQSMIKGFEAGGSSLGVPMLPKPKSEAWLLCAFREPNYQHCAALEQASGNDDSPDSLKSQLERVRNGLSSAADINDAIRNGEVDPHRIAMDSFNLFRNRLSEVIHQVIAPAVAGAPPA